MNREPASALSVTIDCVADATVDGNRIVYKQVKNPTKRSLSKVAMLPVRAKMWGLPEEERARFLREVQFHVLHTEGDLPSSTVRTSGGTFLICARLLL